MIFPPRSLHLTIETVVERSWCCPFWGTVFLWLWGVTLCISICVSATIYSICTKHYCSRAAHVHCILLTQYLQTSHSDQHIICRSEDVSSRIVWVSNLWSGSDPGGAARSLHPGAGHVDQADAEHDPEQSWPGEAEVQLQSRHGARSQEQMGGEQRHNLITTNSGTTTFYFYIFSSNQIC